MFVPFIFRARRTGDWIICTRPHCLVGQRVHRVLNDTNASTVAVIDCYEQRVWVPHIPRKWRYQLWPSFRTCLEQLRRGDGRGRGDYENPDGYGDHGTNGVAKRVVTTTRREINETYTAVGLSERRYIALDEKKRVVGNDAADTEH